MLSLAMCRVRRACLAEYIFVKSTLVQTHDRDCLKRKTKLERGTASQGHNSFKSAKSAKILREVNAKIRHSLILTRKYDCKPTDRMPKRKAHRTLAEEVADLDDPAPKGTNSPTLSQLHQLTCSRR